ncbi:MAG: Slp family lipoprotein, partial [Ectothiorhodospiraceae bacterium]
MMNARWISRLMVLALGAGLSACATLPESLSGAPAQSPDLPTVQVHTERYTGTRVLWGGTIAGVENRADSTLLEVVARPLDAEGRPDRDAASQGRFLATVKGFLDPAVFEKKRSITVVGTVEGTV